MAETKNVTPPTNRRLLCNEEALGENKFGGVLTAKRIRPIWQDFLQKSETFVSKKSVQAIVISSLLLSGGALVTSAVAIATLFGGELSVCPHTLYRSHNARSWNRSFQHRNDCENGATFRKSSARSNKKNRG